jgi:aminopeptidase N
MPAESSRACGDEQIVVFATTPPLPTYLYCWVFDDFLSCSRSTSRGVRVNFYLPRGSPNLPLMESLADAECRIIDFEEEWCGFPFPPPLMQVAIVPRFYFAGMENYGLIVICEEALARRTPEMRMDLLMHETFHMWHGDLVTLRAWNSIYVNEGFARLMPKLWARNIFRNGRMVTQWKLISFARLLTEDVPPDTHAVYAKGYTGDIDGLFDAVTYDKAGMILYQILAAIGSGAFQAALRRWYSERAWQSAGHDDLVALLSEYGDMSRFVTMLERPGYPLIILDDDGTILQVPFSFVPGAEVWDVPLVVMFEENNIITKWAVWLGSEPVTVSAGADWVCLNPDLELECRVWHRGRWSDALKRAREEEKVPYLAWWRVQDDLDALFVLGLSKTRGVQPAGCQPTWTRTMPPDVGLAMKRFAETDE